MEREPIYQYSSPLKFLDSFSKDDYPFFKGRDTELDRIDWLIKQTNLAVVYGISGSGKSSLVKCGVVNRLIDKEPIVVYKGENFIKSILRSLVNNDVENIEFEELYNNLIDFPDKLYQFINKKISSLPFKPIFILDQFEELFVSESKTNIQKFGEFLANLTAVSKVILCIQSEYLADLFLLEGTNPNVLDFKCRVEDPNFVNINSIIDGMFKHFEINEYKVPANNKNNNGEKIILSESNKINRRDLIIENLKKDGNDKIHLPFLQIYLDKLYIEDFIRTYKSEEHLLLEPWNIICEKYPLEFEEEEIKSFGNVTQILTDYINQINAKVSKDQEINGIKIRRDAVKKFLKYFVGNNIQKTGIRLDSDENGNLKLYNTKKEEITGSILIDIWGKSTEDFKSALNQIINELIKARILKKENHWLELSHNLLARVINEIDISDIRHYYKVEFDSAYRRYVKEIKEDKRKTKPALLTKKAVKYIKSHKNYILDDELSTSKSTGARSGLIIKENINIYLNTLINYFPIIRFKRKANKALSKKYFWKISRAKYEMKIFFNVLFIFLVAYFLYEGGDIIWNLQKDLFNSERKINKQKEVYENLSKAFDEGKFDKTQSYELLTKIEKNLTKSEKFISSAYTNQRLIRIDNFLKRVDKSFSFIDDNGKKVTIQLNEKDIPLLGKLKNELSYNYDKYPFYSEGYKIKTNYIISAKIWVKKDSNTFVAFAKTLDALHSAFPDKDKGPKGPQYKLIENITAYEPFENNDESKILFSTKEGAFCIDAKFKTSKEKIDIKQHNLRSLKDIENFNEDTFYVIDKSGRYIYEIYYGNKKYVKNILGKNNKDTLLINNKDTLLINSLRNLDHIKKFDNQNICFVGEARIKETEQEVKKGRKHYFPVLLTFNIKNNSIVDVLRLDKLFKKLNHIKSIKVLKGKIYIAGSDRVYRILKDQKIDEVQPFLILEQEGEISSMDVMNDDSTDDDLIIVGSTDNKSRVFQVEKGTPAVTSKTKELIGHEGNITNVSFSNKKNRILTISRDASLKIWDISSVQENQMSINHCTGITQLKFKNNRLYMGFQSNDHKETGYIQSVNKDFGDTIKLKQKKWRGDKKGNITSFDFFLNDELILASPNNLAATTDKADEKIIVNIRPGLPISGIKVRGNSVVLATNKGLIFYKDATKKNSDTLRKFIGVSFNSVDIHPKEEDLIIGAANDNNIYLWDFKKGKTKKLRYHMDLVRDVCFSKSGKYFVSGSWDNTAMVWKYNEGEEGKYKFNEAFSIKSHISDIEDVEFFNDSIIATASSDNTVQLHAIKNGDTLIRRTSLIRHNNSLRAVTFDSNGTFIYTGDKKGIIKKWKWQDFDNKIRERLESH